jgi:hypothetical protein
MVYENEFVANYSPLPIIIYDFQVVAHDIYKYIESYDYITNSAPELFTKLIKAAWAYRFNFGIDMIVEPLKEFTTLVVNDFKGKTPDASETGEGYWRHIVAKELGLQEYKQGRGVKPDTFNLVCQIGLAYLHRHNIPYFAQEYMEADDIAGKLARIKRNSRANSVASERQMLLYTVDGDWQGLVDDQNKIIWCNIGPWLPRMRNEREVIDYYYRKNGATITQARECYDVKVAKGDAGDGLLAGSPLRLFDLYNDDHEYFFDDSATEYLTSILNSVENHKNLEHLRSAERFFAYFGVFPPVLAPPSDLEIEIHIEKSAQERVRAEFSEISPKARILCKEKLDAAREKCKKLGYQDEVVRLNIKTLEDELTTQSPAEALLTKRSIKELKKLREDLKKEITELS